MICRQSAYVDSYIYTSFSSNNISTGKDSEMFDTSIDDEFESTTWLEITTDIWSSVTIESILLKQQTNFKMMVIILFLHQRTC